MNLIFILPIKMAISHQVLSLGGNLINLAAVEKTTRKKIIELQYCTGTSWREIIFFYQFSKHWVWRVGKTENKKNSGLEVCFNPQSF